MRTIAIESIVAEHRPWAARLLAGRHHESHEISGGQHGDYRESDNDFTDVKTRDRMFELLGRANSSLF